MIHSPEGATDVRIQRVRALITKFDLALGYARLASHFIDSHPQAARDQLALAYEYYAECLAEWAELGLDSDADWLLLEKRKTVGDCLEEFR